MATPPAWKLAFQQHTCSSSRASSRACTPTHTHRSIDRSTCDIDFDRSTHAASPCLGIGSEAAGDLNMIRELAVELLESVNKNRKSLAHKDRGAARSTASALFIDEAERFVARDARPGLKHSMSLDRDVLALEAEHASGSLAGAFANEVILSEAPTSVQSMAVSPTSKSLTYALPWASPVPVGSSSTPSERKRRTTHSSQSSSVVDSPDPLLSFESREAESALREDGPQKRRQKGTSDLIGLDLGALTDQTTLAPSLKPKRPSSALVLRTQERETLCNRNQRDSKPRSQSCSRPSSPTRPQFAPVYKRAYVQPSQSYLRSLTEPRPTTPGASVDYVKPTYERAAIDVNAPGLRRFQYPVYSFVTIGFDFL